MKRYTLLFLLASFCGMNAQKIPDAYYIESGADIKEVTVYTSSAEISYEKEILLRKGKNSVTFTDLTPFIAENSVNVSLADPTAGILTVTERINYTREKRSTNGQALNIQDSITRMKKALGLSRCRSEAAAMEKSLLFKNESIGGVSKGVTVAEIEKASSFFSKRYNELNKELFLLEEKESELQSRIDNFEKQQKQTVSVSTVTSSEITVVVSCPSEKKVKFSFRFLTPKAGWAPLYDFKFQGQSKPLEFVFRANVFNATAIDWQEVKIKLSTADPIRGFQLPSFSNASQVPYKKTEGNVQFRQIEVVNAITEYDIAHEYSIPADSKPYIVDVSSANMPASFNYLLIPKLDPFGFLMAKIPGWNKYNLIPGTANIYNNGSYMGKTFLNTYAENDTLGLYLGKDKSIQATRNEKNINHGRALIGNYAVEETFVEMTIKNNSNELIPVEILDQVPVIEKGDEEKLSLSNISQAKYDSREGSLIWSLKLKAGESVPLSFSYEMKTPKEHFDRYGKPKHKKFRTISCPAF
jgi:hypothetical protein